MSVHPAMRFGRALIKLSARLRTDLLGSILEIEAENLIAVDKGAVVYVNAGKICYGSAAMATASASLAASCQKPLASKSQS